MKRAALALGLVSLIPVFAAPAGPVSAATLSSLISPDNCPSPFIAGAMTAPDVFTSAEPKACKALCGRAAAQCKQYAKGSLSCSLGAAKLERRYGLENCKLVATGSTELKACVGGVNDDYKAFKAGNAELAPQVQADCDAWGDDCRAACEAVPL
jgi:hypothetical protein